MEDRISRYLVDRKEDIKLLDLKPRIIKLKLNKDFILSIVGPRRSGKTYSLYHFIRNNNLADKDYLFVNFEEIEGTLDGFIEHHVELYGKFPKFLFLDEIQGLEKWKKQLYKIYERKRFYIFVTGSSSKFLSKEIATQLRGRSITIKIFPFSFAEILRIHGFEKKIYSTAEIGKIKNLLKICLKEGSFPDIALKKIESPSFISEYIDLVIYKDIMERYGVKNRPALEFFVKNAISSNSNRFSVNKVYNSAKSLNIKVGKDTLYEFQEFLEDVNMIFFLKKYSRSGKETELSLPKAYIVDNALYTYSTYKYDPGILMESFVFQELIKRGYRPNRNLFYFLDDVEVDFVIKDELQVRQLIQVTYASGKDEIEQREIKALLKASDLLKCKDLLCITWDYEGEEEIKGKRIRFVPLWKYLLS